jgi:hypothetical protein
MFNRFLQAQQEINKIEVKRTKAAYKYKYAPLEGFLPEVIEILNKYEFVLVQKATALLDNPKMIRVVTSIIDCKSGDSVLGDVETYLPIQGKDEKINYTQECGAAITYAKRYAISALLGITTDEDSDANTEPLPQKQPSTYKPNPQPTSQPQPQTGSELMSDKQRSFIFTLLKKTGMTAEKFEKEVLKKQISQLNKKEAMSAIRSLTEKYCDWNGIQNMMDAGSFHSLLVNYIKDHKINIDTDLPTDGMIKEIMKSFHAIGCYEFLKQLTDQIDSITEDDIFEGDNK